ncbi:hypothetical protein PanWU01x14_232550 [Parasponia andersonii]|uniref:Uncharacterized protein n=1 Tax=Parasponia andersonii TaxID=3476 RepID=A0A2P5BJX3_PARAD|nr:hypothetical protein PanWU01x14_232550 [Parasponia andersonii]
MDIKETPSTKPWLQLAGLLDTNYPEALLEAWIVYSETTKAERGGAMDDTYYLITLPSYNHGRKPKFKKLKKEFLRPLLSI